MLNEHSRIAIENAPFVSPFDDPECQYFALPETMQTFVAPSIVDWRDNPEGKAILQQLVDSLRIGESIVINLQSLASHTRQFIAEVLGEGEISVLADKADQRLVIREAVFAGVWQIQNYRDGVLQHDYLETGVFPKIVMEWTQEAEVSAGLPASFPDNLMNAPSLLHELFAKSNIFKPAFVETLNLTLLPLTPEDMAFLVESLGLAGISILAKGYGDCRMRRTCLPYVWWVQYFNSPGQLILNTLEITQLPQVAMAAPEDLEDSAIRLQETFAL
jgi:hydrogenase-1 operon protein HyaF